MILILTVGFLSVLAHAAEKEVLILRSQGRVDQVPITTINGVQLSENCAQSGVKCLALKSAHAISAEALQKATNQEKPHYQFPVQSLACRAAGGDAVILSDSKLNQTDFCAFPDRSFIRSMDLLVSEKPGR